MGSNISIRRAVVNDADEAAAIFTASRESMGFLPRLHRPAEDRDFLQGCIESAEMWIAIEGESILGLACICGDWLEHLYVGPAFHNRGIGSALLAKVKEERPAGFQLWAFQANTGARRFYERHGCNAIEFTEGRGNEEKLPDARYMWRP